LIRGLIVNSDDFGYSPEVNAAVLRAHCVGILTSASLMVAEPGFAEAVELARRTPTLGVGLHVVVSYDRALLPPDQIPHLVDANGRFGMDPFRVGLSYAFSRAAQAELRREMEAQFERFAGTGLPWSHADGHQHMHMHPVVWDNLLELCDHYGVRRLRIPHEELRAHFRNGGDGFSLNTVATLFLRVQRRRCLRTLRQRAAQNKPALFHCERVYGQLQTGNMHTDYLLKLLPRLKGRTNEVYFHPGAPHARRLPGAQQHDGIYDVELQALLASEVRALTERLDLKLGRYEDLERASLVQPGL
jgi:hopanoid biosynthesis associated protein HpnK